MIANGQKYSCVPYLSSKSAVVVYCDSLSKFKDENMMETYNLAVCFGPTLLPIPAHRDQVQYQTNVNELIQTIIEHQEEIFPNDGGIMYEKQIFDEDGYVMCCIL